MAATPRALSRGLLSATSATLYTVPASTTAILTSIVLTNTSATAATAFISLDGFLLVPGTSIGPLAFTVIDLRQALTTGKASTIDYDTAWTTASSGATGYYRLFLFGIGTRN
jgi:hypothetical protein